MAHQLKYYKEIESHGHLWRVEILQETEETVTPMEIGPVLQGLKLVLQGDQADIDTPIVKTSLEMTFVDAPDLEEERKCGYWEEFYTSSATEYQVKLYKDGQIEWTGYITPDSFAEDLRYRGSVSIIARDNLGILKDIPCDIDVAITHGGHAELLVLINTAMKACKCAMEVQYSTDHELRAIVDSNILPASFFYDIEALHEMSWWEALESVLYSAGYTLRYIGENKICVQPLRGLPFFGKTYGWEVEKKKVLFKAAGHRELLPGIKAIRESIEFETSESVPFVQNIQSYLEEGASGYYENLVIYGPDNSVNSDKRYLKRAYITNASEIVYAAESGLIDPARFARLEGESSEEYGAWDDPEIAYYVLNASTENPYSIQDLCYTDKVKVCFTLAKPIAISADGQKVMNLPIAKEIAHGTTNTIRYRVSHRRLDNGAVTYYDASAKTWKSAQSASTVQMNFDLVTNDDPDIQEVSLDFTLPSPGLLRFEILRLYCYAELQTREKVRAVYMRIKDYKVEQIFPEKKLSLKGLKTTTNYSDKYAVVLERSPKFAVYPSISKAVSLIRNALVSDITIHSGTFNGNIYAGLEQWFFKDDDIPQPLTVMIHQQLLAYYSKPNNVLTGELMDADGSIPDFSSIWRWNGADHLVTSGALNILTGRMEGAQLREFKRYDHMWETWVENEDETVDYTSGSLVFRVHSGKDLGQDALKNVPSWMEYYGQEQDSGVISYYFNVMENASGQDRSAIFQIDTAYVRVTQRAAGDYGTDYGKDYS